MAITRLNNNSITSVTALPSGVGNGVLQTVQGISNTNFNGSSNSYTDIITINITPSSTSSKIYLMATCPTRKRDVSPPGDNSIGLRITKDGSNLVDFGRYLAWNNNETNYGQETGSMNYLDTPSTTSQITYVLQFRSMNGGDINVNHDLSYSSLTAMEIAG